MLYAYQAVYQPHLVLTVLNREDFLQSSAPGITVEEGPRMPWQVFPDYLRLL